MKIRKLTPLQVFMIQTLTLLFVVLPVMGYVLYRLLVYLKF